MATNRSLKYKQHKIPTSKGGVKNRKLTPVKPINDAEELITAIFTELDSNLQDEDFDHIFMKINEDPRFQLGNQNQSVLIECLEKTNARILDVIQLETKNKKSNYVSLSPNVKPKNSTNMTSPVVHRSRSDLDVLGTMQKIFSKTIKPVDVAERTFIGIGAGLIFGAVTIFTAGFNIPLILIAVAVIVVLGVIGITTGLVTNESIDTLKNNSNVQIDNTASKIGQRDPKKNEKFVELKGKPTSFSSKHSQTALDANSITNTMHKEPGVTSTPFQTSIDNFRKKN